jgi:hypothetical protein
LEAIVHVALVDLERGEQALAVVALVLVLAAGRRGGPGTGSGLTGALAWMSVFSSIETTSTFSGGPMYRPQTAEQRFPDSGFEKSLMIQ